MKYAANAARPVRTRPEVIADWLPELLVDDCVVCEFNETRYRHEAS